MGFALFCLVWLKMVQERFSCGSFLFLFSGSLCTSYKKKDHICELKG